ncbi:hypothetical protein H8D64_02255 [PVC group bacterium]|nr:hypothetical protein [PVC group bacterium]
MKIAHIINPVSVPEESDLFAAQPITFDSIRIAKAEAEKKGIEVNVFTTQYPEDRSIIPETFTILPDMQQSVLDYGTFLKKRKLPLIRDILNLLYEHCGNADLMIYTNVDIALMPFFYNEIVNIVEDGLDAFIINRRTIPSQAKADTSLTRLYSFAGKLHPGWDCYIFRKELFPALVFKNTCIGAPLIGQVLYANLALEANCFREFTDRHLTFHIGDDRTWTGKNNRDYWEHNRSQLAKVLNILEARHGKQDRQSFPGRFAYNLTKSRILRRLKMILGR